MTNVGAVTMADLLRLCQDLSPADWLVERLHDFAVDVGSVVPEGYEAFLRLFHPAGKRTGDTEVPVRWAEVAAATGTTMHREA
ncbi:MAG: hypothetical protein ACE5GC_07640 [Acidimicrobiia bacterium]